MTKFNVGDMIQRKPEYRLRDTSDIEEFFSNGSHRVQDIDRWGVAILYRPETLNQWSIDENLWELTQSVVIDYQGDDDDCI